MPLILTPAQAGAVYSAMCALNAVSEHAGQISVGDALVMWRTDGHVAVASINTDDRDAYHSQSAFATAYGLQQG